MNCIIRKFVLKRINALIKDNAGNIDAIKSTVELWSGRVDSVQAFLASILRKLDDGEITPEEIASIPEEFEELTKGWK